MKPPAKRSYNVTSVLAKVGQGQTHTDYQKSQKVFSQGEPADAVFYIQKGKGKLTAVSQQGKEAIIAKEGKPETVIPKISQERNHSLESQPVHEQVPQTGVHRLQRPPGSSQLIAKCRSARLSSDA
jgi:CRP-like cAMP-binding protein